MTPFRKYQDVAVVEHDPATGKLLDGTRVRYGTVTEVRPWSVTARIDARTVVFLVDSRGRAWCEGGRLRLVPLCHRCEEPVTGTPVTAEDDPAGRPFCSEGCLDAAAEASHEQRYQPGVAT